MTWGSRSILIIALLLDANVQGFAPAIGSRSVGTSVLFSKKGGNDADHAPLLAVGTLVEFQEKKRVHIGKVTFAGHKSNGGGRYDVVDPYGHHFSIADKAVSYTAFAPNSESAAKKLLEDLEEAHCASERELQSKLDISSDLLEIAWEEAAQAEDHVVTPKSLIELIHSHTASTLESYMAWRLLRENTGHVFFRELKDHGRVTSFKAKAKKAVDAAKRTFCDNHEDEEELCFAV